MVEITTVGVLVECEGNILILHRNPKISQGGKWGLPAGRAEEGESNLQTAVRELYEETGYRANPEELSFVRNFDWHFPEVVVYFPTYRLKLESKFNVKLDPNEHQGYKWISPKECYKMKNLIHGFHDLLKKVYNG